jgi:hypothetical protein
MAQADVHDAAEPQRTCSSAWLLPYAGAAAWWAILRVANFPLTFALG